LLFVGDSGSFWFWCEFCVGYTFFLPDKANSPTRNFQIWQKMIWTPYLERLRTAHVAVMTLKVILCQSFHESISNLVFGVNRDDLDESLAHMFAKMMIANVYVLGPWV
jgi:hypothetical protein